MPKSTVLICNIRLPNAESLYFMRVPEFVVMNTRTNKSEIFCHRKEFRNSI